MGSARGEATDLIRAGLIRESKDEGRYEVTAYGEILAKHIEAEAVFKVVLIAGSKHAD